MPDEMAVELLSMAYDEKMDALGFGAGMYDREDYRELDTSDNWDEWHIDNAIDREREERMLYER